MAKSLFDELHETATSLTNAKLKSEYESIVAAARKAAQDGDLSITRSQISDPVIKKLRDDKLTITYNSGGDQRDPYPAYYTIKWDKPTRNETFMSA